jgi:hypothetical protein
MNGGTKTGLKVQTAPKADVRSAGFPPAPPIEEELTVVKFCNNNVVSNAKAKRL